MLFEPGHLIGAYEILGPLGQGGMGEVYRARHTRLGMLAAIKVVSARLESDPAATERLNREARLASSLNHPAIVTIHDIGEIEGRTFIVMEFIDGEPLSARLAAGPMKVREAADLTAQVADGLAAAHDAGVVHRDLKPQNIMVTADGRAKIVDFGLSKLSPMSARSEDQTEAEPRDITAPHTVLGSAGYMSPEQVSGRPVTFRTDQFALGVVLYEMLTGRRAFHGDSAMDTLAAILKDEPVPIAELCPTLPPRLVTIVERCLAKRPENRYGSTRDLARDLAEARNLPPSTQQPVLPLSQPVPVSPNSDPVTPKPIRYRGIVTAAVLLIAALAGVGYAFYMRAHRVGPGPAAFRQVAVLPFTCADPNDQVFCDGIMETLTIDLTQLSSFDPSLRVVSQQVLRRDLPPDKVRDPAMARSVLGATISITGDVTRRGSETVVTLTRIDANRSQPRSIGIADGQEAAMPRELVAVAATLLDVKLSRSIWASLLAWWEGGTFAVSASIDKHGTAVPQAYLAYLRGRGYLHGGKASADQAIAVLKQAVQADPGYVQAHAALCEAYWQKLEVELARAACLAALQIDSELVPVHLALIRNASSKEKGEAISRAENLVRLARFSSDAHTALGQAHLNNEDLPAAEAAYLEGLRDLPDDSQISGELCRLYLIWANKLGKPANKPMVEQARSACQQAARLTPDSTRVLNSLGSTLLLSELYEDAAVQYLHSMKVRPTSTAAANLGLYSYRRENYDEAATRYEQAIAGLGPSDPVPNRITAWQGLGAAYWAARAESGKWKNAYQNVVQLIRGYVETKQMTVETMDDSRMLGQLADAYSMLNQQAGAHAALEALEHRDVKDSQTMFAVASAYAQIDDRTRALQWLKRAVDAGYPCDQVTRSPFIKELRKDQKYQSVGCK